MGSSSILLIVPYCTGSPNSTADLTSNNIGVCCIVDDEFASTAIKSKLRNNGMYVHIYYAHVQHKTLNSGKVTN